MHNQPVAPLPLEPNLVPNPPLRPDQVPQRGLTAPVNAVPRPAAPVKPAYLQQDAAFPETGSYEDRVLWLLARYPHEGVRAQWEPAGEPGAFARVLARYIREVDAYAAALDAAMNAPAGAAPAAIAEAVAATQPPAVEEDEDEPSAAELEAAHAEPQVTKLPHGSTIIYTPAPKAETTAADAAAQAASAERRRLGKRSKEKVLELYAAGKDRLAIAQETGLPIELVDRALEGAQRPAAAAATVEAAPPALPAVLEESPKSAAPAVVQEPAQAAQSAPSPNELWELSEATQRLRSASYIWAIGAEHPKPDSREAFLAQLYRMQRDLGVVLAWLEDRRG